MPATARLIVMMEEADKAAIEAEADAANLSTAEFVRRRLLGRGEPEERAFVEMLAELKPLVRRAAGTIEANLVAIRTLRRTAEARDAGAAARARREVTPGDLQAVADRLRLGRRAAAGRRRGART